MTQPDYDVLLARVMASRVLNASMLAKCLLPIQQTECIRNVLLAHIAMDDSCLAPAKLPTQGLSWLLVLPASRCCSPAGH